MADILWRIVAWIVSRPLVASWIIQRAQRTPYTDIRDAHGDLYMERRWLFNPYFAPGAPENGGGLRQFPWCPISIRLHTIVRPDRDRHLHDHPWNARTIILRGWYVEMREDGPYARKAGGTARLRYGEFHRIVTIAPEAAVTLFITGRKRGTWGFKVPYREYLDPETGLKR